MHTQLRLYAAAIPMMPHIYEIYITQPRRIKFCQQLWIELEPELDACDVTLR